MSDLLRGLINEVERGYSASLAEKMRAALAAAAPPPDRNDLLAVGRAQSQHDAGGSRSSPAAVPSTTEQRAVNVLSDVIGFYNDARDLGKSHEQAVEYAHRMSVPVAALHEALHRRSKS